MTSMHACTPLIAKASVSMPSRLAVQMSRSSITPTAIATFCRANILSVAHALSNRRPATHYLRGLWRRIPRVLYREDVPARTRSGRTGGRCRRQRNGEPAASEKRPVHEDAQVMVGSVQSG
jgi:hypothetical protein